MKSYSKNFKPEFKVILDYLNIKGIYNSIDDNLFIGKSEIMLFSYFFKDKEGYSREIENTKSLLYFTSMWKSDHGLCLYIDEFYNFYINNEDEKSYSEISEIYNHESHDSLEENKWLDITLKRFIEIIEEDKEYNSFKLNEKLNNDLKTKQTTKKRSKI